MKILLHTIFYAPDLTGVAKYTAELCEWLAGRGHEVRVVAPPPYYPQWRIARPYRSWRYMTERIGGVSVHRCPIWLPTRPGGIGRIAYALSYALASAPVMFYQALRGADLVLVIEPSLLNAPAALMASRFGSALAWLHVQDYEVELAYGMGQLRHGRRLAERIESWVMRRFDAVSSISLPMVEKAQLKGVATESLALLANSVDLEEIRPLPDGSRLRRELGIASDSVIALFAGSLGAKQGVETAIEAARILAGDSRIVFVVCGDGPEASRLREQAGGAPNVRFLPLQPADRLNDLLNMADVHLLPQQKGAAGSVLPSKLINMLASGRPVIAACGPESEIAELILGCGIAVAPGDLQAMASAICGLAADPEQRERMGEAARKRAVIRFCKDSILQAFERDLLDRLHRAGRCGREGLAPE